MAPAARRGRVRRRATTRRCSRVPKTLQKHAELLCVLSKAKPRLVKQIISGAEPSLVKAFTECSYNLLQGNVPLTKTQLTRLRRYKAALRSLAKKNASLRTKKAILQRGGFIGALLGPVVSSIVGMLPSLAKGAAGILGRRRRR